jgi:hypothetical protein
MQPNKKKALIEILEQLKPYWELAEGFMILVKEAKDDNLADDLLKLIYDQMKKIEHREKQKLIYEQLKMIKKHNFEMEVERKEAESLLDDLLTMVEQ